MHHPVLNNPFLKQFYQLLSALEYPDIRQFQDESQLCTLFLNVEESCKVRLFTWIIQQLDPELGNDMNVTSEGNLRSLLHRSGIISTELECANFLGGLLGNEKQLKTWRNIFSIIYQWRKMSSQPESDVEKDKGSSPVKAQAVNLLPDKYQQDFEHQVNTIGGGSYEKYVEKMKHKLEEEEEEEDVEKMKRELEGGHVDDGVNANSLETTIDKILNFKPSSSQGQTIKPLNITTELEQFDSNFTQRIKPNIKLDQEGRGNFNQLTLLNHFSQFVAEYAHMSLALKEAECLKRLNETSELNSSEN